MPVVCFVSRNDSKKVRIETLHNVKSETLKPLFEKNVKKGTRVDTDEYNVYNFLERKGYEHRTVNHGKKEYAREGIHCNKGENLWSIIRPYIARFRGVSKIFLHFYVAFALFLHIFYKMPMIEKITFLFECGCNANGKYLRVLFRYKANPITAVQKKIIISQFKKPKIIDIFKNKTA